MESGLDAAPQAEEAELGDGTPQGPAQRPGQGFPMGAGPTGLCADQPRDRLARGQWASVGAGGGGEAYGHTMPVAEVPGSALRREDHAPEQGPAGLKQIPQSKRSP